MTGADKTIQWSTAAAVVGMAQANRLNLPIALAGLDSYVFNATWTAWSQVGQAQPDRLAPWRSKNVRRRHHTSQSSRGIVGSW